MTFPPTGPTDPTSNVIAFPSQRTRAGAMARHPASGTPALPATPAGNAHQLLLLAQAAVIAERELSGGITDPDGGASLLSTRATYTVAMAMAADSGVEPAEASARAATLTEALENFDVRTPEQLVELALAQVSA